MEKETIELVKKMIEDGNLTQEIAEKYCSELKESEDEKIRKELISFFTERAKYTEDSTFNGLSSKDILAWLEKLGEQKHTDSKIIDLDELVIELEETIGTSPHSRETIKDFFQKAVQKYMKCLQIANGEIGRLMDENYYLKEQKSAEWSEEDEEIHRKCICAMRASACGFPEEEKFVEQVDNWLKSLKYRVLLQQKQGWSEEDYNEIESIACHLDNTDNEDMAEALRSIRDKYYHIIPQSTWKPSDEQMVVLNDIIINGHLSNANERILKGLQEQLKKLREGKL